MSPARHSSFAEKKTTVSHWHTKPQVLIPWAPAPEDRHVTTEIFDFLRGKSCLSPAHRTSGAHTISFRPQRSPRHHGESRLYPFQKGCVSLAHTTSGANTIASRPQKSQCHHGESRYYPFQKRCVSPAHSTPGTNTIAICPQRSLYHHG